MGLKLSLKWVQYGLQRWPLEEEQARRRSERKAGLRAAPVRAGTSNRCSNGRRKRLLSILDRLGGQQEVESIMGVDMKTFAQVCELREIQSPFALFYFADPGMRDPKSPGQGPHRQTPGLPACPQPP